MFVTGKNPSHMVNRNYRVTESEVNTLIKQMGNILATLGHEQSGIVLSAVVRYIDWQTEERVPFLIEDMLLEERRVRMARKSK